MTPLVPITEAHVAPDGRVPDPPASLARIASAFMGRHVSGDVYALARMVASETDWDHPETAPLRVHVALNDLADLFHRHPSWEWTRTPLGLLTYSSLPSQRGTFGEQFLGRRYATTKNPTAEHVFIVEQVMQARALGEPDPTGGALKFIDKLSMGKQRGSGSYEAKAAQWAEEGLHPGSVDGMPDHFVVFRRTA